MKEKCEIFPVTDMMIGELSRELLLSTESPANLSYRDAVSRSHGDRRGQGAPAESSS